MMGEWKPPILIDAVSKPTPPLGQPPWRLQYFIEESGACDVMDYLDKIHESHFDDFVLLRDEILPKLQREGPDSLRGTYWTDLGGGLAEIKWGVHRIYCCVEPPRRILALVAVEKRFRAFQSMRGKYKTKCERRRAEMRRDNYNEHGRNKAYGEHRARRGKA
jgi:hypothetical protein